MAVINRDKNIKSIDEDVGKKENPVHHWLECQLVQLLWKRVWRFLKKLKRELTYDPAIPLLGIYLKKIKNTN